MANQWHVSWLKEGVDKWNKRRKKVSFVPNLSGVKFFDLLPPDFRDNPKTSRYFEKINLSNSNLSEADLSNLNFSRASFSGANLSFADLSKSNFHRVNFTNANLQGVNLEQAHVQNALFEKTNLYDALFGEKGAAGAIFISTDISKEQHRYIDTMTVRIYPSRREYLADEQKKLTVSRGHASSKRETDDRTKKNRYDVFFGTDRKPIVERGSLVDFSDLRSSEISYGICEVIVPEGHQIGSLGSPIWKRLLNRHDDRLRLENMITLNKELFWSAIQATGRKMKVPEKPTIFVHGYNTTFQQAVLRAAQIGYDLGVGQGIGLFSWPSKGSFLSYSADEAASEASKYMLADFIEQFILECSQKSVNIIAHSMGCRCVLGALEVLSNGRASVLKSINQIILAAADVDSSVMPYLAKHAVDNCTRTTSYVSDKDKALKASGWLHSFPRVGITPPSFVFSGMDTIHVNNLDLGDFSHGYLSRSRIILNDIFNILKYNLSPPERHAIEAVSSGELQYWRMKD